MHTVVWAAAAPTDTPTAHNHDQPCSAHLHALLGLHQSGGSGFLCRIGCFGGSIVLLLQVSRGAGS